MTENELFKKMIKGDTEGRSRKKNTRAEKGKKKKPKKEGWRNRKQGDTNVHLAYLEKHL